MSKEELQAELANAKTNVDRINALIQAFDTSPENNVFESMERAESVLQNRLRGMAFEDCEGAGNCGLDSYSQEFIVDGNHYIGTLKLEYNRHDKTYYYIDDSEWTILPKA